MRQVEVNGHFDHRSNPCDKIADQGQFSFPSNFAERKVFVFGNRAVLIV